MDSSLHHIQLQILTRLMQIEPDHQRYSELMIPGIENDLFNYHLQNLVKKGYIEKANSSYALTEEGKKVISKLDALGNPKQFFKVSVTVAVFRNNYTELLVQRRTRNPFYGDITTIAGKVLPGEKIVDAARRKLLEEANLAATFTFVGVLRKIKRNIQQEILEDTFYHCCVATEPVGVLIEKNVFGENFWIPSAHIIEYEKKNIDSAEYDIDIWKRFLKRDFSNYYLEQDAIVTSY